VIPRYLRTFSGKSFIGMLIGGYVIDRGELGLRPPLISLEILFSGLDVFPSFFPLWYTARLSDIKLYIYNLLLWSIRIGFVILSNVSEN